MNNNRVLSGMPPTGRLHLGHYHGVIKNWLSLQYEYDCYFMVADIHALTTGYENTSQIKQNVYDMVMDWLACGVDPSQSVIFVQSQVPQHAELHTLLSQITPISWLERVPIYKKDVLEKSEARDIDTYGFLGYPLLQSADILLYNAKYVPMREDQVSHIELAREIARRFNHLYGREEGFEQLARSTIKKLGAKKAQMYESLLVQYQQQGIDTALEKARYLLQDAVNLSSGDRNRLFAFLENKAKVILTEPESLITNTPKLPGLDGQKMSTAFGNTIMLREDIDSVDKKIRSMQTDPARVRRTDKGTPEKCPVWQLHQIYSSDITCKWVVDGCTTANIGCLDCKKPLIDSINDEQKIFKERVEPFANDYNMVRNILADGAEKAHAVAVYTIEKVRESLHLDY